jgi:pantetheine-phosphate adenylyltransferase
MKVALGGTFEPLHEGHKKLIDVAVKLGGKDLTIGITSDEMARKKIRSVLPFEIRAENVRRYVMRKYGFEPEIVKITDPYGKTLEVDFEYIVVSPETCKMAHLINKKRKELGKKEIKIVKVDFVMAEDGKPISATRIKKGIIDRYGRLI